MGFASCLENNTEKVDDNRHMRGHYEAKPERRPVFVVSPPLQPAAATFVIPAPPRPDAETIAKRERSMHEKHVLALFELMPGSRWRQ
jgi:hypothetical protein